MSIKIKTEKYYDQIYMYKIIFMSMIDLISWSVLGRVVRVVGLKLLAIHRCGFESRQGRWILSFEESVQLAYGASVVQLGCSLMPDIKHGRGT